MAGLPPPPLQDAQGSFGWLEWYRQLRDYLSTASSIPWNIIQFAGSKLTDIQTRLHGDLQGIQGGSPGERYHLTATQLASIGSVTSVRTVIADTTVTDSDYTILCDATTLALVITLPLASSLSGREFNIKKIDSTANAVTITPSGSDTVDSSTTAPITTVNISITVQSNGTDWYIL